MAEGKVAERSDPSLTGEIGEGLAEPVAETVLRALLVKIEPMLFDAIFKGTVPSRRLGL